MLELLSPAGSTEAVIAAVQSGADIIHIGYGVSGGGREEKGFSPEQLSQALRYCRVRGCRTLLSLSDLCSDDSLDRALQRACFAAEQGVDALLVQDLGLARALRSRLPEMPLWADVRVGTDSLDGALAAAALGFEYAFLSPELSLEEIRLIAEKAPIKTAVFVHGQLCFARPGQCYMNALGDDGGSAGCGRCGDLCRRRFSLGGRMDDYPLSMKDICLLDHLDALTEAGVTCAAIEGHSRSPEFVAYATGIYTRAIREHVLPTAEERSWLTEYFATNGLTDGYLTGEKQDMTGVMGEATRDARKMFAEVRKGYMDRELRRIPLNFYVVMQPGEPAVFAAEDNRGNRAVYKGFVPIDLGRTGIGEARVRDLLYRTGGTPYFCAGVRCSLAPRMDYPEEAVEDARRELINRIAEAARQRPEPVLGPEPEAVENRPILDPPRLLCQISELAQLSEALAAAEPDGLYVPAELLLSGREALAPFRERGCPITAVMPRAVSDREMPALRELMTRLRDEGVTDILGGSLRYVRPARSLGLQLRGDYGLNVTNASALAWLKEAGLRSATVSFELSLARIRAMAKPLDTEMLVYGRMPVMLSDQCIVRRSAGRCACHQRVQLQDENGGLFPVMKESGCRNVIFDRRKIYLADRQDLYRDAGLWAVRLLFTSESARDCVEVTRRYKYPEEYRGEPRPNNTGRGLYPKGAIL